MPTRAMRETLESRESRSSMDRLAGRRKESSVPSSASSERHRVRQARQSPLDGAPAPCLCGSFVGVRTALVC